jgi:hypothetical protein
MLRPLRPQLRPRRRGDVSVCSAAATLLLVTACSLSHGSNPHGSGTALVVSPSPVSHTPTVTSIHGVSLPIEAYKPSAAEQNVIIDAEQKLTADCMGQYGFTWAHAPSDVQDYNELTREYGVADAGAATRDGYHAPPDTAGSGKSAIGKPSPGQAYSAAELLVLTGSSTGQSSTAASPGSYHGRGIPAGGCQGQARMQVTGVDEIDPQLLADSIGLGMWKKSQTDARVVAAFKKWSACMAQGGYTYADPLQAAADHRWSTLAPSQTEIQTAQADVACKKSTNLIGVWYTIESAYESAAIQQQIQQLTTIKNRWASAAKKAASLLGVAAPK